MSKRLPIIAPEPGPPTRTAFEAATDVGVSALHGVMMGLEAEFGGDMAITGMTLDRALARFLDDVTIEAGRDKAAIYARNFVRTLERYASDGMSVKHGR